MRNMFDGDFVNGLRHGYGTFYYANGAKYEGGWKNNMKHGKVRKYFNVIYIIMNFKQIDILLKMSSEGKGPIILFLHR